MSKEQFKKMIRYELRIPPDQISFEDIDYFFMKLDVDKSNYLSAWELNLFLSKDPTSNKKQKTVTEQLAKRMKSWIKAATIDTSIEYLFSRCDEDEDGYLNVLEFTKMVRNRFKVSQQSLNNAD